MLEPEIRMIAKEAPPEVFADIARLHIEEITDGFLTSLGAPLLTRLYDAVNRSSAGFILAATVDGAIVGFLCASTDTARVYRQVLGRSWPRLLPVLLPKLVNLRTMRRVWETIRYPSRGPRAHLPSAEILNFCVSKRLHRGGVGRRLFSAMEAEFHRRGVGEIRIVTGATQLSAIRFYEKIGADLVGAIEVHGGQESRAFRYAIRSPEP